MSDTENTTTTAAVTMTVKPINDAPDAAKDEGATQEDHPVMIDVLANDHDIDGDTLNIEIIDRPEHGSVSRGEDGVLVYTPAPNFHGQEQFEYTVSDGHGGAYTSSVTVVVASVNDAPEASDDSASTTEDAAIAIQVLQNDDDLDGDALKIEAFDQPANGSTALDSAGIFTYTPNIGFNGQDSFTCSVSDGNSKSSQATVVITITAVNDAPIANDDAISTLEDTPVIIQALGNDSDRDGDQLKLETFEQPENGKVTLSENGELSYEPNLGYSGEDLFIYTVSDGNGGVTQASVIIQVIAVNAAPEARNHATATNEGVPITIHIPDHVTDADNDAIAIDSIVTQPLNGRVAIEGNGNITYTPKDGFHGFDGFGYRVSDGQGGSDTAWVNIEVAPGNTDPVVEDSATTTTENTAVLISLLDNANDADGDTIQFDAIVTEPKHGEIIIGDSGQATYIPEADFTGFDGFGYQISDGKGGTDTAWINIEVTRSNEAPVAGRDSGETQINTPLVLAVLENDADPDGDALTIVDYTPDDHGSLSLNPNGTFNYEPNEGFAGYDCFSYVVSDGQGGIDVAKVQVHVIAANQAPVAANDAVTTLEDKPLNLSVLENDNEADGYALTIVDFSQPEHGLVTLNEDGSFNYTPEDDYSGQDTFRYSISDGNGGSSQAVVIVSVTPVNDAPTASDDAVSTHEDTPTIIQALGNDSDPDGDELKIETFEQPENGKVTLNEDGTFSYEPNPQFCGTDRFTYTATDGNGASSTATVTVTVERVNDAPIAKDDATSTLEDTPVTILALGNDSDPDGDELKIETFEQPENGKVTLNEDGTFSYEPNPQFCGTDRFTYTATDGNGRSGTATVIVTVEGVNDAPSATDDFGNTDEGQSVVISVLDNDSDPENSPLSVSGVAQPANGSVQVNPDGTLTYTPNGGFHGTETFSYTVSDENGGERNAQVILTVEADTPPVCAKLVGDTEIEEGGRESYQIELSEALDHDSWYLLQVNDGTAQRVDQCADNQDIMWGGFFVARNGIGGEVIGVYEGKIPNGPYLHQGMRNATGPADASWDYGVIKDNQIVDDGALWVKLEAGQTRSESIDIQTWKEAVTVDQDAGTSFGHLEGTEQLSLEIAGSRDAGDVEICEPEVTINIHDQSEYRYVSPIALDLNRDGQIGVTGNSTAKDKVDASEIGRTVQFDIDADGEKDNIEWLNGNGDAMLVDNRDGLAATDMDGSRLFGDQPGEFEHGYENLAQLDKNADGQISGAELQGLSLWVDDGDAIVEDGEMASLFEHGITALSTEMHMASNAAGESLMRSTAVTESGEAIMTEDVWFAAEDVAVHDMLIQEKSMDQLLTALPEEPLRSTEPSAGGEAIGSCEGMQKLAELYEDQSQDITCG